MPIDAKTTALLLIEYQNDFTSKGGALHPGVKAVMESTNMLANSVQLANQARAAGVTVMFAPTRLQGLPGDHRTSLRHPQRRGGCECVRARNVGRGHRGRDSTGCRRHHHRGQARARYLCQHESGLHPSVTWDYDAGRRRVPDQLLCGIHRADRLREGFQDRSPH